MLHPSLGSESTLRTSTRRTWTPWIPRAKIVLDLTDLQKLQKYGKITAIQLVAILMFEARMSGRSVMLLLRLPTNSSHMRLVDGRGKGRKI